MSNWNWEVKSKSLLPELEYIHFFLTQIFCLSFSWKSNRMSKSTVTGRHWWQRQLHKKFSQNIIRHIIGLIFIEFTSNNAMHWLLLLGSLYDFKDSYWHNPSIHFPLWTIFTKQIFSRPYLSKYLIVWKTLAPYDQGLDHFR